MRSQVYPWLKCNQYKNRFLIKSSGKMDIDDVHEPILTASPEVKEIIERVWKLEKNRLEKRINSHINDDIVKIIKEVVR